MLRGRRRECVLLVRTTRAMPVSEPSLTTLPQRPVVARQIKVISARTVIYLYLLLLLNTKYRNTCTNTNTLYTNARGNNFTYYP